MGEETMVRHVTDVAADEIEPAIRAVDDGKGAVPGPSPNPATNMMMTDIALRGVSRLIRNSVHKAMLQTRHNNRMAKKAVENRSMLNSLIMYGVSKVATRSVPGFMLVSSGLAAKTLYDRSQNRRDARSKGRKTLRKMAQD